MKESNTSPEELSEKLKIDEAKIIILTEKIAEQTKNLEVMTSELSHHNDGETGFNPTVAELASVFEGIKAEIEALGK